MVIRSHWIVALMTTNDDKWQSNDYFLVEILLLKEY